MGFDAYPDWKANGTGEIAPDKRKSGSSCDWLPAANRAMCV
jgi:hypothetical protein